MIKKMAHIIDGKVINVSVWDGVTAWTSGDEIVEITDTGAAGIGWDYIDGEFVDNRPTEQFEN
jgi:hypothetical protein